MALLDVSELLLDPDFIEKIALVQSVQTISSMGIASNVEVSQDIYAVICHLSPDDMKEMPHGSYVSGSIRIHTRAVLRSGADGRDADMIDWNGNRYQVAKVEYYGKFGVGFTVGYCIPFALSGGV